MQSSGLNFGAGGWQVPSHEPPPCVIGHWRVKTHGRALIVGMYSEKLQ